MILDRTWNKKEQKLTISYIDKLGNRQFYRKYLHHWRSYEYDEEGDLDTWNGKKCRRVFKDSSTYSPNDFDILEFLYELDPDILKSFHEQNFPKLYTFDIETEVSDEFPDPEIAEQKVTSISLVGPDMSCMVMALHDLTEEQKNTFKQRYLEWIDNNEFASARKSKDKEIKVLYQYFETEEELLKHFVTKIIAKVPCLAGWNSYAFDWQYIWNRMVRLFGKGESYNMLRKASPTGEVGNIRWEEHGLHYNVPAPKHVIILDYMALVKQYDYSLRPYESYGLDWVGNAAVKAHKIKYDGTLQQLYERDPEWYYFYNAVDSLIVLLIHYRLKSLESPCAVSSLTLVPLLDAMGQIALTTANFFEVFYEDKKHVVFDYNEVERVKVPYQGAFCGCVPGRYDFVVCDDFKSLYPSQIITCNLSVENFCTNKVGPDSFGRYITVPWTEAEIENFKKDPNYFVSIQGNVYKNDKDYAFRRVQKKLMSGRDKYKYTGQQIDSVLLPFIDKLLKGKTPKMEFTDKITDFVNEYFPKVDFYNIDKEELEKIKEEVLILKDEYALLENAYKVCANAGYGSCANQFFYFYNVALAADITAECRNLTLTMNSKLEKLFHEDLWDRKDLWERFDFGLDPDKKEWLASKPIWVYSDTDSSYTTYGNFFRCFTKEYQDKYKEDSDKIKWILKFNKEFLDKQNNEWCREIYNPRHGNNVHEFELETISRSAIYIKKKNYLKGISFKKGKFFDTPKIDGTGIELIKSTTPKLCRKILKDMTNSLMFEYDPEDKENYMIYFNDKLSSYRKEFYNAEYEDISQSVGVGEYKKYVINDKDALLFASKAPVSVKAIARYNYLAHQNGQDNLKIYAGKIKYYRIRETLKQIDVFGFPAGELPPWAPKMDKITQWEKTVIDPINRFLEVMDINKASPSNAVQLNLFD